MSDSLNVLNRLVQINLKLSSSFSTEEILTELMNASAEVLGAESASVILLDPHTRELHFVAITSEAAYSEKLRRIPVPIDSSIAGSIVRENKNIILDDVTTFSGRFTQADDKSGFRTRSLLGVPMRINDKVVGALEAVNKINGHWTEDDERYLEILAAQAATALEKAELVRDLRVANEELSKVDKIKNDFIAIASHELRTPLGVILGYASFLKEEAQGELSDHADAVMNSALRMRNLIEDMTNLRLINMGEAQLETDYASINELINSACNDVYSMAEARQHKLFIEPLVTDVSTKMDRQKMLIALTNLLNNAVKFTPNGGRIEVRAIDKADEVWIQVSDTGVGISEEHFESIFKTFAQVEDHMTRRHGGMGLGLSIAKAVVEAHKGRIWVESPGTNQGSTFILTLPKK